MKKLFDFIFKSQKKSLNLQRVQNSCKHEDWIFDERKESFQCKNCEVTKPCINF